MTKVEMYTLAYKQGFKGMVYTLTTRGVEDAENLAQDVYLKAWQKLSQFKGSFIEFKGWIASIRESTYKDFLRNRNTDAMGFAGHGQRDLIEAMHVVGYRYYVDKMDYWELVEEPVAHRMCYPVYFLPEDTTK